MILVREGRAEERHEAVAEELVDRALVAMHLRERGLEEPAQQRVHGLGAEPFGERGRADDVAEQYGDGLALALDRAPRGEDLLGEMTRRVRRGRRRRRTGGGDGGGAALDAEPRAIGERVTAGGTDRRQLLTALETELRAARILPPAPRALHAVILRAVAIIPRRQRRRPNVTVFQDAGYRRLW